MGITIDEHIKRMGDIRSNYDRWSGLGLTPNEAKEFDFAIDNMRKLYEVSRIVNRWKCYGGDFGSMQEIYEVLNGDDD